MLIPVDKKTKVEFSYKGKLHQISMNEDNKFILLSLETEETVELTKEKVKQVLNNNSYISITNSLIDAKTILND